MTQKDFVKAVAVDVNSKYTAEGKKALTEGNVSDVLSAEVKVITDTLVSGDKLQIAGLGTFCTGERAAREGRNPSTGATIQIPASKTVKLKAAKALKDAINK